MRTIFWLLLLSTPSLMGQTTATDMKKTLRSFTDAFNRHDVEAMLPLVTDDLHYMFITDATLAVETKGKDALRKSMKQYFEQLPSARSEMEEVLVVGQFLSVRERAHWQSKDGPRSQIALAVYQFKDGLIHRVWYHAAQP